ncbi:hypothetical protein CSIM01_09150 [Colletotrichum simmondsii]|uniref:Uncharacterized protein n=1 Tax=Colletotrichum simmondsii TaxID=703756 RepID=A0A135TWL5_9PEZI|nr:hypothetical protein CSIM01_09150 [Colletotrichum simmondsii]
MPPACARQGNETDDINPASNRARPVAIDQQSNTKNTSCPRVCHASRTLGSGDGLGIAAQGWGIISAPQKPAVPALSFFRTSGAYFRPVTEHYTRWSAIATHQKVRFKDSLRGAIAALSSPPQFDFSQLHRQGLSPPPNFGGFGGGSDSAGVAASVCADLDKVTGKIKRDSSLPWCAPGVLQGVSPSQVRRGPLARHGFIPTAVTSGILISPQSTRPSDITQSTERSISSDV